MNNHKIIEKVLEETNEHFKEEVGHIEFSRYALQSALKLFQQDFEEIIDKWVEKNKRFIPDCTSDRIDKTDIEELKQFSRRINDI